MHISSANEKHMHNKHSHSAKLELGVIATMVTFAVALFFGGAATEPDLRQMFIIGIALICGFGLVSQDGMQELRLPWPVLVAIASLLSLPLLQLIPLQPEIWRALPGRGAETAIIDLAGGGTSSRPLALNPDANLQLFASLTALCIFALTVARLNQVNLTRLLYVFLALALVQFLVGAIQFTTAGASLDFFGNSHKGWLLGTFANRNHAGLFFACSILITVALAEGRRERVASKGPSASLVRLIFLSVIPIWLLAAIGTGSRTGFMLSLLATAVAVAINLRGIRLPRWAWLAGIGVLAAAIAAVQMSDRMQKLVERYDAVGDDQRWSIWHNSIDVIANYLPWGSGFGSFVWVYNKSESMEELAPTYVNNAHNDYLELIVEAGIPGAAVLGLVIVLVIVGVIRGGRSRDSLIARQSLVGGGIVLLFACHSFVDYPVRRIAMAMVLFLAFGLLLRQFGQRSAKSAGRVPSMRDA